MKKIDMDYFLNSKYFVVDFENTGGSLKKGHKITGVGVCIVEPSKGKFIISEKYSTLVNPERNISKFIENLIGIKTKEVNNDKYPKIDSVFKNLEDMYKNDIIFTAHAVKVDYTMYDYLYFEKNNKHLDTIAMDTLKLSKKILEIEKANIGSVAELFEMNSGNHHQPDFDALVASKILIKSLEALKADNKLFEEFKNCYTHFE